MKNFDLISVGELLVDMTPGGQDTYVAHTGGGPANMACMAARLGTKTAFIGQVGDDTFGRQLGAHLERIGVDISGLAKSKEYPTTLAFVHLAANGERSFSFYRHGGADTMLTVSPQTLAMVGNTKCLFMSSVMMAEGSARESCFCFLEEAKNQGVMIAFDPNLRLNLWKRADEAKEQIKRALPYADIVKVSEEELAFLTDTDDVERGAEQLLSVYDNIALLLVTLGAEGTLAVQKGKDAIKVPSFSVHAVDTTGAGDAFTGAFLSKVLAVGKQSKTDLLNLSQEELITMVRVANAAGALTTTKPGGIDAQPTEKEIDTIL